MKIETRRHTQWSRGLAVLVGALLLTASHASLRPAAVEAAATLKVVPSDVRVRRAETPPSFSTSASLEAARNEFESFQVVIDGGGDPLSDVSVSLAGPLAGPPGSTPIPASNVTIYREDYVHISTPSDGELFADDLPEPANRNDHGNAANHAYRCDDDTTPGGCYFPDILIPTVDPLYGEPRDAFPVDVPADQTRVAWIDVLVPRGQAPGTYSGQLEVSADDGATSLGTVPIEVDVLPFRIPSSSALGGSVDMDSRFICKTMPILTCANPWETFSLFGRLALDNRMSLTRISGDGNTPDSGNDPDFAKYTLPLLAGTGDTRLRGAQLNEVMTFPYCTYCAAAWKRILVAHGRADLARRIGFHCDEEQEETCKDTYPEANAEYMAEGPDTGRLRLQAITRSADRSSYGPLTDQIDTDLVSIYSMQPKGGASIRPSFQPWLDADPARHRLFLYESCSSLGCDGVHGGDDTVDYTPETQWDGWPSYGIDQPATEARAMGWMAFKFGATGEYYYESAKQLGGAWKDCQVDNLDCIYAYGGNGDGTLFYPGTVAPKPSIGSPGIGGTHDIPLESMRMKEIRDGREDYAFLQKVPVDQRAAAMAVVDGLYPSMSQADVTPAQIASAREQIAAMIPSDPIGAPPDTTIESGPSGPTKDPTPTFEFSASVANATFDCRVDQEQFAPCSGPGLSYTTSALPDGEHSFAVRAEDVDGQPDPTPASRSFVVDTAPPQACQGVEAQRGTPGDDGFAGTAGPDAFDGLAGNDRIAGNAGADHLCGDDDSDAIAGGPGGDTLDGGRGVDFVAANAGDDRILASDGAIDFIDCGAGTDTVDADAYDSLANCEAVNGRPLGDLDGDGIAEEDDRCATLPGPGYNHGCPDNRPPETTIRSHPPAALSTTSAKVRVKFGFKASEASRFRCVLGDGPWESCSNADPHRAASQAFDVPAKRKWRTLTFRVRAVDRAGLVSDPAEFQFRVRRAG